MLKQWLQTGKTQDFLRDDYNASMSGVLSRLVQRTYPNGILMIVIEAKACVERDHSKFVFIIILWAWADKKGCALRA